MHVTLVPYIAAAGELKSKPTQHSVKELRSIGIQPDVLVCRSDRPIPKDVKAKIGLFCNLQAEAVISAPDVSTIYEVPLMLHEQNLDDLVVKKMHLNSAGTADLSTWKKIVDVVKNPAYTVRIGIVGKYVDLKESYKSLNEALIHGGIANNAKIELVYIDSDALAANSLAETFANIHGILVPGGFGERGAEGKILAVQYARENNLPYFGICFGMQLAVIEFARNVAGIRDATSREFAAPKGTKNFVIDMMTEQRKITQKGGTMRLGSYSCKIEPGTLAHKVYEETLIHERHRHRYEFNNKYREILKKYGMSLSGVCEERDLVEMVEIPGHPWFLGCQFHPEFKSKPMKPHPLFTHFVLASLEHGLGRKKPAAKVKVAKAPIKLKARPSKKAKVAVKSKSAAPKSTPQRKAREFYT